MRSSLELIDSISLRISATRFSFHSASLKHSLILDWTKLIESKSSFFSERILLTSFWSSSNFSSACLNFSILLEVSKIFDSLSCSLISWLHVGQLALLVKNFCSLVSSLILPLKVISYSFSLLTLASVSSYILRFSFNLSNRAM